MSERRIKKGKIAVVGVGIVILVAIIIAIVLISKNSDGGFGGTKKPEENKKEETVIYDLPDITYSDMQVTNIEMEYLKENNETMVSMVINNTTEVAVAQETLTAYLIDGAENVLGQTRTYIESLNPGEQYSISVVLKGDLTATKQIKLQK